MLQRYTAFFGKKEQAKEMAEERQELLNWSVDIRTSLYKECLGKFSIIADQLFAPAVVFDQILPFLKG